MNGINHEEARQFAESFLDPLMQVCIKKRQSLKIREPIKNGSCFKDRCKRQCPILAMPKGLNELDFWMAGRDAAMEFYGIDMNMFYSVPKDELDKWVVN